MSKQKKYHKHRSKGLHTKYGGKAKILWTYDSKTKILWTNWAAFRSEAAAGQ